MSRKAFTMIELMVAMAIVAILAGMILVGVKHMSSAAKVQATRVRLENLKSMLAEYELKTRLIKPASWPPAGWTGAVVADGDFWRTWDTTNAALVAPGNVGADSRSSNWDRWANSCAMAVTEFGMAELARIPSNAAAIGKLPGSDFLPPDPASPLPAMCRPAMLDAWGNPILVVPARGLEGVTVGGGTAVITNGDPLPSGSISTWVTTSTFPQNSYTVLVSGTSRAFYRAINAVSAGGVAPSADPANWQAVRVKGFFASAGPDGDFSKGDDNLYSFEQ